MSKKSSFLRHFRAVHGNIKGVICREGVECFMRGECTSWQANVLRSLQCWLKCEKDTTNISNCAGEALIMQLNEPFHDFLREIARKGPQPFTAIQKLSSTLKLWKFPFHYSTQPGPVRRRSCEPSELVSHLWILLLIFAPTEFRPKIDFELRGGEVFLWSYRLISV